MVVIATLRAKGRVADVLENSKWMKMGIRYNDDFSVVDDFLLRFKSEQKKNIIKKKRKILLNKKRYKEGNEKRKG